MSFDSLGESRQHRFDMTFRSLLSADSEKVNGGAVGEPSIGPAFSYFAPKHLPLPVLIAVPHAGRSYPAKILDLMRDAEMSTLRLEDRLVDLLGSEVAKQTGTGLLVAQAPRAMLDLNRSRDDVDWEMVTGTKPEGPMHSQANRRARSGLGLVPRRLPGFGEIWTDRISKAELDLRIDHIHRPYHRHLSRELDLIRNRWGAALLLDLHSMPPLRRQPGQRRAPQIVLGDRFGASCHASLAARAFRFLEAEACPVAHNRPYSGGYVLDRHASPARGIHAIQVEVCRSTYLDEQYAEPSAGLASMAKLLAGLVRELGAETARLGDADYLSQAAE